MNVAPFEPTEFTKAPADLTPFIPQAGDFQKVLEFPIAVHLGNVDARRISRFFGFTTRQSSYYRQATEMLDLVKMHDHRYELTELGQKYVTLTAPERYETVAKLLLKHPIMRELLDALLSNPDRPVTRREIANFIKQRSKLTRRTLPRRTQTIIKWFE